ncbi:MAG: HlyC/CorC family transporter [Planctomycetia bacterium]|nr:HlyC/CorC family transporter [Planctomycetia bacterium]
MWGTELAVMAAMIVINAVFAAYEIALAAVSKARLQLMNRENRRGAHAALYMKDNMEASLAVVQLGITLVGAIAAATGGAGAEEQLAPFLVERVRLSPAMADVVAIAIVVVPLTFVTIIFGELIPKVFALRNKEWLCLRLSPTMRIFGMTVWPAVWMFETVVTAVMQWGERRWQHRIDRAGHSEEAELQELRATAHMARALRLIGHREEKIILRATELSTRPVKEIALPAEHITMLSANDSVADCLVAAHLDMHTRFPVTERPGDPQAIIGYVNFKDIVAYMRLSPQDPSMRSIVRPIPMLAEDVPISLALETLMRERTHIALVKDGQGKVLGMVTLEDILEELVGEIEDEFDRLPAHATRSGEAWVVGGGMSLERLRELSGIDLRADVPANGARTVNDWVVGHLGKPVRGGEILTRPSVRLVVRKVRRQKVQEAQVQQVTATATSS